MKPQKPIFWAAALLTLIWSVPLLAEKAPKLQGQNSTFDFGYVLKGAMLAHTFVMENEGDAPLIIEKVTDPCDCLTTTFDKTIAPDAEGRLQLQIDTAPMEGPFHFILGVYSNDAERPITHLRLRGYVKGPIAVLPRSHFALSTVAGKDKMHQLFVEVNRPVPLKIKGIESTIKAFTPRVETVTPGRKYRILIKARGDSPVGRHEGKIHIKTDDPQNPVITIDGSVLILSSVIANPGTLFLSEITPEQAREGVRRKGWKILLKNVDGRPFSIVDLKPTATYLRASHRAINGGKAQELLVEVLPNDILKGGKYASDLFIKTNLPDAQNVKVPVFVEVR